jgi:hypothetical protein
MTKQLGFEFEFSGSRTLQIKGKVDSKFQKIYGRIRAIFNGAGLKDKLRNGIWTE